MKSIIQALISIEENYSLMMEKIENDKNKLPKLIEEKISQGTKMINSREREKLIYINRKIEIETMYEIESINKTLEDKKLLLKEEYKKNMEIWEKNILNNILDFGGEI